MESKINSQTIDSIAQQAHTTRLATKPRVSPETLSEPWSELSASAKEYERGVVRAVIEAMEKNGLQITERETSQGAGRSSA